MALDPDHLTAVTRRENEVMKLPRTSAWYHGRGRLIKSLHMLQLSELVEQ